VPQEHTLTANYRSQPHLNSLKSLTCRCMFGKHIRIYLIARAPSDSVFGALCINWLTYLLIYSLGPIGFKFGRKNKNEFITIN